MAAIYEMLILTPTMFRDDLLTLVNHKYNTGIRVYLTTLDQIYSDHEFTHGRDEPEKIKLYIASIFKLHHIKYAMLIGDVDQFPVRYIRVWDTNFYGHSFWPSDLYYADLFDDQGNFSTHMEHVRWFSEKCSLTGG